MDPVREDVMTDRAGFLFTAFEPSGDALAASVIGQLQALCPEEPIWAFGGARCEAAGARMLEHTTHHATMFLETLKHIRSHRRRLARLRPWLDDHRVKALVPTDSPAANWSICKLVRRCQPEAKIVHLAAPQLWAWAPWRIGKLRRLTDHLLCLLPFEPSWFGSRGVPSTFVGHPLFTDDRPRGSDGGESSGVATKLALLPGSRTSEINRNWPTMLSICQTLQNRHGALEARVAALDDRVEAMIRRISSERNGTAGLPDAIRMCTGQMHEVLRWCDVALVVCGTAVLEASIYRKPMVAMYNVSLFERSVHKLTGRRLITTDTFALPNLVSQWQGSGRAIPEFAPHSGRPEPIVAALEPLVVDAEARSGQRRALDKMLLGFADGDFNHAAERLLEVLAR